ncbi:MAG: ABC transporter permease subunit [Actinophytocola sp.]|uniref:ABC transporter permease n=1 Tax=Actinophytocola sp. TaxID=1872138 RepID=UPI00132611C3|nr:ABC transporter permease [Actinophytocola sp.]MPZ83834.1 ABC transporter permease subunit [Actinophytocola sp.]
MARRVNLIGAAVFVLGLGLWELLVRTGILSFSYLPPPTNVAVGLSELLGTGELVTALGHTLFAALTGWAIAGLVGVAAGSVLGLVRPVWTYSMASLEALRALPIVAFVPVAVLLFGFSVQTEIMVAFYAALWPVLLNTISGMRTEQRMVEAGAVLRLSRAAVLWKIRLPAATASIVVGLRLGLSTALVLTLVAEMVGNPAGLGFLLVEKGQALQPAQMFAAVCVIGVTGIVLNGLVMGLARVAFRGQLASSGETA